MHRISDTKPIVHFVWLVRSPATVYRWTFVRHLHYQRSKTCSRHICSLVPTSVTNCFQEYEQRTLYSALVVTLAMLLRLINCRFNIINAFVVPRYIAHFRHLNSAGARFVDHPVLLYAAPVVVCQWMMYRIDSMEVRVTAAVVRLVITCDRRVVTACINCLRPARTGSQRVDSVSLSLSLARYTSRILMHAGQERTVCLGSFTQPKHSEANARFLHGSIYSPDSLVKPPFKLCTVAYFQGRRANKSRGEH